MTDDFTANTDADTADAAVAAAEIEVDAVAEEQAAEEEQAPAGQYGLWPFTIREVAILGTWFVAFVVSFFSLSQSFYISVWTAGISWVLLIGAPTVATGLIVLRRLSPEGIRRVGSLGIDQFASVAYSVAAFLWFSYVWDFASRLIVGGQAGVNWVIWVELVLMLGLVTMTVFGRFISPFAEDFAGRPEIVAHTSARPVVPVIRTPKPEPVAVVVEEWATPEQAFGASAGTAAASPFAAAAPQYGAAAPDEAFTAEVPRFDQGYAAPAGLVDAPATGPVGGGYARRGHGDAQDGALADTGANPYVAPQQMQQPVVAAPVSTQPFWALAPVERDVVDERTGQPLFRVGPTAWALVVVDRGTSFIVRHEDGRVGVLHDVSGVTRG